MAELLPLGEIPTFPHGRTCCSSMPLIPELRRSMIETIEDIAGQSDGVRCDMAMLLLNSVFERTWRGHVGAHASHRLLEGSNPLGETSTSGFSLHRGGLLGP